MGKQIHYYSLAWDLLAALGKGAILASVLLAPNVGSALRPFLRSGSARERRQWDRWRVQRAFQRLRERRYVRLVVKGNETYLAITNYGKERLKKFNFDALTLPPRPRRWNGVWQLVIFDIPEQKKRERRILQGRLDDLGLLGLQRSVFIYPYPCEDEIDFLSQFLDVDRYVHVIAARSLGSAEGRARRHFGLL